jgi:ABC-type multidrug transport system fused ATPase/permease subunit
MVSLILRFYDVNEGKILIDGIDIRDYDLPSLRKAMGLVMQEPTLFNYTVAENILYGQTYAYNSEIREATQVANATEFIESHQIENAFDDSADSLFNEMTRYRERIIAKIGPDNYEEILNILNQIRREEEKKGKFVAVEGDIDRRGADKKNISLHNGYGIQCGIKGSKLSGGQKQRIAIARAIIRRP